MVTFTADVQARNHQHRSRILPNGRNSRLQNALDCITQAVDLCQGGTLVINGDLTDDRNKVFWDELDAVMDCILTAAERCFVILSPGNHDQFLKNGSIHSMSIFKKQKNILVVPPEGGMVTDREETCDIFIHPFTEDNAVLRNFIINSARAPKTRPAFLVLHTAVQTALLGNGELDTTGIAIKDLKASQFEAVILGHYHKPQQLCDANIYYVGSPYQVKADEGGDEKRFLVWDGKRLRSVPIIGMPKFINTDDPVVARQHKGDFVTLTCLPELYDEKTFDESVLFMPKIKEKQSYEPRVALKNFDVAEAVEADLKKRGAEHLIPEALKRLNG